LSAGFSAAKVFHRASGGRDLFNEAFGEDLRDPGFDLSPILSVQDLEPKEALEILIKKSLSAGQASALEYWWRGLDAIDRDRCPEAREMCRRALAALPAGRLALVLHWHWALLYEGVNGKAYEREMRELRRVQRTYGASSGGCDVCGRKS
jgi:hypothetical protein